MGILSDLFGAGRRRDVSMQGQIDGIISRLALIEVGSTGIGVTPAELAALSAEVAALRDRVATIEADVAQAHIDEGAQAVRSSGGWWGSSSSGAHARSFAGS